MAFSGRLGVIGILGVSWLLAVGCGDDGGKKVVKPGAAGAAGEAPSGGKSSGGSTNNGGKGGTGTAGKGGSGGKGGMTMMGSGGDAGAPAVLGGAGGEAQGGMGVGGAAAGAGGEGGLPEPALLSCANQCEIDDDCVIGTGEFQNICDPGTKRCVDPFAQTCSTADDCLVSQNFFTPCTTTADCDDASLACATWQGAGYCMPLRVETCEDPAQPLALPEFGNATNQVDVCAAPAACKDKACQPGCEVFGGCVDSGDGDTCSATTHLCECTLGTECATTAVCGADGHCAQCVTAQDCPGGLTGQDTCVNGKCGCSGAAVCPDLTAAATPVCE
jgi:hypothetical protein